MAVFLFSNLHARQPPYWILGTRGACSNLGNIGSSVYFRGEGAGGGKGVRKKGRPLPRQPTPRATARRGGRGRGLDGPGRIRGGAGGLPPKLRLSVRLGGGGAARHHLRLPGKARAGGLARPRARRFLSPRPLPRSLPPRPNMAGGHWGPLLTALLAARVAAAAEGGPEQAALPEERSWVRPMTASNWTLVMEGEWMLKL